jgi:hypothetical protein
MGTIELVLFAIQAAVKLGRKVYDVLVDETVEAPLLLPIGDLAGSIALAHAIAFFDGPGRALRAVGGPYHDLPNDALVQAYVTVTRIEDTLGTSKPSEAVALIANLHAFEQRKQEFGPNSPWQRILGTVVEIGVDYFVANPKALAKDSSGQQVIGAFLVGIDDIDFAEGESTDLVRDTLMASLKVLGDDATLVSNDKRISVLLGGVTRALRQDLENLSLGEHARRDQLFKRITASIVRAGAGTIADNPDLFVDGDATAKRAVRSTLTAVLGGIRDSEDLFSNAALERLFSTALTAVAQNSTLFANDALLRSVIGSVVAELTRDGARELFSGASVEVITRAALEAVAENSETLIDAANPKHQFIARAVAALAQGLGPDLAGPGGVRNLLSTAQLERLTAIVFQQVARNPEQVLGGIGDEPRRTALAQILGSLASALGDDPAKLVNGSTLVDLIESTLHVALKNSDKLLDSTSIDPQTNLLFTVLAALSQAARSGDDARKLIGRDVFLETAQRILPIVSANLDPLLGGDAEIVKQAVQAALELSTGTFENRINGANLPPLIAGLLRRALQRELSLSDHASVENAADLLLRMAT